MNQTNFNFSITNALKESWRIFKLRPLFYMGITSIMVVFNYLGNVKHSNILIMILIVACAVIWSYTWLSVALDSVDHKDSRLDFKTIGLHFPHYKQALTLLAIGLLTGACVIAGFILLIIPGIYVMTKLFFANMSYVDRQDTVRNSMNHSWDIVKGNVFWTTLLTVIVSIILIAIGGILYGIVMVVTYPLSILLIAQLYRAIGKHHANETSVVEQPKEISAETV